MTSTGVTIKVSKENHEKLKQLKKDNALSSIDDVIDSLLFSRSIVNEVEKYVKGYVTISIPPKVFEARG